MVDATKMPFTLDEAERIFRGDYGDAFDHVLIRPRLGEAGREVRGKYLAAS